MDPEQRLESSCRFCIALEARGGISHWESVESAACEREKHYPKQGELPLENLQVYGMYLWRDEEKEEE